MGPYSAVLPAASSEVKWQIVPSARSDTVPTAKDTLSTESDNTLLYFY